MAEVTILMACRNGAAHLEEQLASIAAQQGVEWRLIAGDDGSTDGTRGMLERFAADWPERVLLVEGPRKGASAHFLALIAQAEPGALAFADQDDVWLPGKLAEGLEALKPIAGPTLYVSRGALWWGGEKRRVVDWPAVEPGFRHALVQNIGPGHAMVVDAAAAEVLRAEARAGAAPYWHDWWVYQLVTARGGKVLLGNEVQVLYRQHEGNLVGRTGGGRGLQRRLLRAASGQTRQEVAMQVQALLQARETMTAEAEQVLDGFAKAAPKGVARARALWRLGLHRQGPLGRVSVAIAGFMGAL